MKRYNIIPKDCKGNAIPKPLPHNTFQRHALLLQIKKNPLLQVVSSQLNRTISKANQKVNPKSIHILLPQSNFHENQFSNPINFKSSRYIKNKPLANKFQVKRHFYPFGVKKQKFKANRKICNKYRKRITFENENEIGSRL